MSSPAGTLHTAHPGDETAPLRMRPTPYPRNPAPVEDEEARVRREQDDFWAAWAWTAPESPTDAPAVDRPEGRSEPSDVAALLPDDLLDPEPGAEPDRGHRGWARRERRREGRIGRRAVAAVGSLAVLSGGFLAGVVVDRAVAGDALDAARASGGAGVDFTGAVEADANGTLAVVSPDGQRRAVRTTPSTQVVSMNLLSGDLPPGTPVQVRTRQLDDGSVEATSVAVTGQPGVNGS